MHSIDVSPENAFSCKSLATVSTESVLTNIPLVDILDMSL